MKYDTDKMIKAGRDTMKQNPARDITLYDFYRMKENAGGDEYLFAENSFLLGVAIGKRIAEAERRAAAK